MIINEIFKAAELNAPAAGYIYAIPVDKAAVYIPEEALNQLKNS
jgi:hypothetical protein